MLNLELFLEYTIKRPKITSGELATFSLLLFFIILSILEAHLPKIKSAQKLRNQSYRTNISLFLLNSALLPLFSASSLWLLADYYANRGLLSYVSSPVWQAILAFLVLDLMLYIWHRACHHFDYLWMFHRVHHSDSQMNVSTAFRIHILELLITSVLKGIYIIVLGVDKIVLITEETIMTLFIMIHHTNISFPGENLLRRIVIVPYLHRVHHSLQRHEHDRNYGAVLSLWDQLFGTWATLEPVAIGIKSNPAQDVISQLKLGFTPVESPAAAAALLTQSIFPPSINVQAWVAEAAYYKAQNRGFLPGHDLADWLEAENEIIKMIHAEIPERSQSEKPIALAHCPKPFNGSMVEAI